MQRLPQISMPFDNDYYEDNNMSPTEMTKHIGQK